MDKHETSCIRSHLDSRHLQQQFTWEEERSRGFVDDLFGDLCVAYKLYRTLPVYGEICCRLYIIRGYLE